MKRPDYPNKFKHLAFSGILIVLTTTTCALPALLKLNDETPDNSSSMVIALAALSTGNSASWGSSSDSWSTGPYAYYKTTESGSSGQLYARTINSSSSDAGPGMLQGTLSSRQDSRQNAVLISDSETTDVWDHFVVDSKNDRVYFLQKDGSSKWQLYRCDMKNRGARRKLNRGGELDATEKNLHHDGSNDRIFYIADEDTAGQFELYMIEMTNPDVSTRVNATLTAGTDVKSFQVSPDGARVLYRVDNDLLLVDLDNPGVSTQVTNPGNLLRYDFSLDSSKIVFNTFVIVRFTIELYVADVTAPATTTLLPPTQNGTGVFSYQFLPSGNKVIYTAEQDTDNVLEMYLVSLGTPGVSTKVNPALVTGGDIYYDVSTFYGDTINDPIVLSPDGSKVIYAADLDTDEVVELYVTDLATPGAATKLNPSLVTGGDVSVAYQVMDDNDGIVYVADQDTDGMNELYLVEASNPTVTTKLNQTLVTGGNVKTTDLFVSGNDVYYMADAEVVGMDRMYKVSIDNPGNPTQMDDVDGGDARTIQKFVVSL